MATCSNTARVIKHKKRMNTEAQTYQDNRYALRQIVELGL